MKHQSTKKHVRDKKLWYKPRKIDFPHRFQKIDPQWHGTYVSTSNVQVRTYQVEQQVVVKDMAAWSSDRPPYSKWEDYAKENSSKVSHGIHHVSMLLCAHLKRPSLSCVVKIPVIIALERTANNFRDGWNPQTKGRPKFNVMYLLVYHGLCYANLGASSWRSIWLFFSDTWSRYFSQFSW